jgi:hypothetical protein
MRYIIALIVLFALMVSVHHVVTERGNTPVVTEVLEGVLVYSKDFPSLYWVGAHGEINFYPANVYDCAVNSITIGGNTIFHFECIEQIYGTVKALEAVAARGPNAPTPEITHLVR